MAAMKEVLADLWRAYGEFVFYLLAAVFLVCSVIAMLIEIAH
jgi:hypothetical protein